MTKIRPMTARARIATVAGPIIVAKSRATWAASLKSSASKNGSKGDVAGAKAAEKRGDARVKVEGSNTIFRGAVLLDVCVTEA